MLHVPQIIMIIMFGLHVGKHIAHHGHPMRSKYNGPTALLSVAASTALLWTGGFFG